MIARLRRLPSTYLGLGARPATIGVASQEIVFWYQHETLRLPGVSQTRFFFSVALVALQGWLAMRPGVHARTPDGQGFLIAVPALTVGIIWLASEVVRRGRRP